MIAMGGGIGLGNVTPEAEFNIHCDPFSAAEVLCEMPEVVLAPLNVTNRAAFSLEEIGRITAGASPAARAMERILTMNYHACVQYGETGSTMHDSTAVLCGLFPELFRLERCEPTMGGRCAQRSGRASPWPWTGTSPPCSGGLRNPSPEPLGEFACQGEDLGDAVPKPLPRGFNPLGIRNF